ncbi:uncharacterized [Tachysurus ichikawai]
MNQLLVSKHLEPFPGFLLLLSLGPDEAPPAMPYDVTAAISPALYQGHQLAVSTVRPKVLTEKSSGCGVLEDI